MFLNRCGYIRSGSLDPKSRGSVSRKKISCRDPFLTACWRRGRRAKEGICDAAALDHHFRAPARHVRAAHAHANAREHSKHTSRVVSLERGIERFARSASRAPQRTASVRSFPRRGSDTAVMRVASFPGGEAALAFGRVPSTPTARARFPIVRGASPVDVAASAANDEPVSPSSRVEAKTHLRSGESLAFDMLFDDATEAADMEDVEEMDEAHGDSEDDAHDPVSVYVRYATRGPARTPDASPGPCAGHTTASSRSNEPTRVFSSVIGRSASNERALSEKSKKYPSFPVRTIFFECL